MRFPVPVLLVLVWLAAVCGFAPGQDLSSGGTLHASPHRPRIQPVNPPAAAPRQPVHKAEGPKAEPARTPVVPPHGPIHPHKPGAAANAAKPVAPQPAAPIAPAQPPAEATA